MPKYKTGSAKSVILYMQNSIIRDLHVQISDVKEMSVMGGARIPLSKQSKAEIKELENTIHDVKLFVSQALEKFN